MLRSIQSIGWSCLDPAPVNITGPVSVLIGQNGSGKSSTIDAVKALLGARRFGGGRSASSYRFGGRGGEPPLERAYVLGVVAHRGRLDVATQQATMVLEVGPSRRRFTLLEGEQIIDPDQLDTGLERLRELPRSGWMSPVEWEQRVLGPLGVGPAFRRLLELPQGEIARALDRDSHQLLELLLELSGGRDASEQFAAAREAVAAARSSQAEARRRLDRSRAELAEAELAAAEARRAGELRARLGELGAEARELLASAGQGPRPLLRSRRLLSAAGIELIEDGNLWAVRDSDAEHAAALLGPGECLPLAGIERQGLVCGPAAGDDARSSVSAAQRGKLTRILTSLEQAGIELEEEAVEAADPAELIGAFNALASRGIPAAGPAEGPELGELEQRVGADRAELTSRGELLENTASQLEQVHEVYEQAVEQVLAETAERFEALCEHAGFTGKMEIAAGVSGARECQIWVAEEAGEALRPLTGTRASLSGGWRAAAVTLAILACLGTEQAPPLLLLDEVGASLDEERLGVLGTAFARLGEESGLLTIMTVPSKTISQTVAGFAAQQIAFFRPRPDEALAPPPHLVAASPRRLLRRAA